jgi:hypothetical protein
MFTPGQQRHEPACRVDGGTARWPVHCSLVQVQPARDLLLRLLETWAEIAGALHKAQVFVATLPASNVYFAKAYPIERLECLLDGLCSSFVYFGGLPGRAVLDNTSLAVKRSCPARSARKHAPSKAGAAAGHCTWTSLLGLVASGQAIGRVSAPSTS